MIPSSESCARRFLQRPTRRLKPLLLCGPVLRHSKLQISSEPSDTTSYGGLALAAARCLAELKGMGVRIALDDFGTGYSSLSYVKRFPVDSLKIDRSFVGGLETDPEAQAICTAIIAMAHQLDLRVVAEGVETDAQERFLEDRDCDELQAGRFSRPVDAEVISRLLCEGTIEGPDA
jgi:EAL domain-containing protein (putative c-di-GMP-specific phosphodiesterase class I)